MTIRPIVVESIVELLTALANEMNSSRLQLSLHVNRAKVSKRVFEQFGLFSSNY
jgi:hypothetical protein